MVFLLAVLYAAEEVSHAAFAFLRELWYAVKNAGGGKAVAWFVYMLRCCDGSLYTGYTDDVQRRLGVHQSGKGAKYTRSRLPVSLAYYEELPDKSAAMRREAAIKRLTRQKKLELIEEKERL